MKHFKDPLWEIENKLHANQKKHQAYLQLTNNGKKLPNHSKHNAKVRKGTKMSFKNLIRNIQDMQLPYIPSTINHYLRSERTESLYGANVVIGDVVLSKLFHKDCLHFPLIACVFETKTIFINEKMRNVPDWVLEAFILHEKGHLQSGIGSLDSSSPNYLLGESVADEYSQNYCGRMYQALLWYYEEYPIFLDYRRLEHLENVFKINHRSYLTKVLHKHVYSKVNNLNP